MNSNLLYVVGPSGAGKDSLIDWLMSQPTLPCVLHWAVRDVTRADHASSQRDRAVSESAFAALKARHAYALCWQANGLSYGVRHEEMRPLAQGHGLLVNGSRRHLPAAAVRYPGLTVLHITADVRILRQRLTQRGREHGQDLEQRLSAASELDAVIDSMASSQVLQVFNNGNLEDAGQQLLAMLARWSGCARA